MYYSAVLHTTYPFFLHEVAFLFQSGISASSSTSGSTYINKVVGEMKYKVRADWFFTVDKAVQLKRNTESLPVTGESCFSFSFSLDCNLCKLQMGAQLNIILLGFIVGGHGRGI